MDVRTLVAGEADVADLARALRRDHCFQRSFGPEHTLRIRYPDHLMELHKVDAVGLEPAKRFLDLLRGALLAAAVDLGHQKRFVAVAVAQRFSHAQLARTAVVVPAVVEEVDAVIDSRANDADGLLLVGLPAEVVAAHADQRHHFAGAPQATIGNPVAPLAHRRASCGASVPGWTALEPRHHHAPSTRRNLSYASAGRLSVIAVFMHRSTSTPYARRPPT